MKIGDCEIGPGQPPYIVAEVGANHGGDLDQAIRLIDAAKDAGANAVKVQAYTADTITIQSSRPEFMLTEGPWQGQTLYDLYKQAETPFEWFPRLFDHAKNRGITCFASVFDPSAVDCLERLGCPAYKIASFELVDLPLIRYAARTGKPLILSTGLADQKEIDQAVGMSYYGFRSDVAVLHCVSGYPTPIEQAGLKRFREMRALLHPIPVGISDHSLGIEVPVAATALGACMIEKHLTVSRLNSTPDGLFSMEMTEFAKMANVVRKIWSAMQPGQAASEKPQQSLRRSLYVVKDIAAGELFTNENVRSIRPGAGLAPWHLDEVLGRKAVKAIVRGTPLSIDLIYWA